MNEKIQNLLHQLKKNRQLYWNISPETGLFLNLLIKNQCYKTILEIGSSNGYSGIWLAEALKKNNGHLYTIESHKKERYNLATENFKKSGLNKYTTLILGHAPEDLPKIPKKFDLIFLDATKEEYLSYFQAVKRRLKKDGLIIADNLYTHAKKLEEFVKTTQKESGWQSFKLKLGAGLFILYKK